MVAPGIYHVKARLVGIENATSAQPKNLASAPRLSPLRFFGGVAGDETIFLVTYIAHVVRKVFQVNPLHTVWHNPLWLDLASAVGSCLGREELGLDPAVAVGLKSKRSWA